jgi:hypothetical protein
MDESIRAVSALYRVDPSVDLEELEETQLSRLIFINSY